MEKKDCAFGIDILKGELPKMTPCKSACLPDCRYHTEPLSFKTGKRKAENIKK